MSEGKVGWIADEGVRGRATGFCVRFEKLDRCIGRLDASICMKDCNPCFNAEWNHFLLWVYVVSHVCIVTIESERLH